MKLALLFCGIFLSFGSASFANNNMMFEKANQLYHNKNYDSAASLYMQMINDHYESADLYYNAGNANYRLNKIGMAVWCYEKALQLKFHRNYQDNLSLAKKRIKEPIEQVPEIFFLKWWRVLYSLLSVNGWAFLALGSFLVCIMLLIGRKLRLNLTASPKLITVFFALSGMALLLMWVRFMQDNYRYYAIVTESRAPLKLNGNSNKSLYLSEGVKVKVLGRKMKKEDADEGTWITVVLPDGREGDIALHCLRRL